VKIGIDITVLYVAKAGIYYHHVNLLKHLLALENDHEFVLFDYAPIRSDKPLSFDLRSLESERVRLAVVKGPRQPKLINWKRLDFFGGRFTAQMIDAMLEYPWQGYITARTRDEVAATLAGLDVFHASDVTHFMLDKARLVATVHDLSPMLLPQLHTQQNRALFQRKMRYVCAHAQTIITVSEHTKRDLMIHLGLPAERIRVVYNSADPKFGPLQDQDEISRVMRKYALPESGYILFVGTLESRKNLVRLVEAYARVREHNGEHTPPLVLAGGRGWLYRDIFATVERLKLHRQVIFTGFVDDDDLPALYNNALFFVYPSLYEGFGIPVLEAMACGVPVIAADAAALPEIVGEAGLLVEPTDTPALTQAMLSLLTGTGQRNHLREAGLKQARLFSWDRAARETLAVYEQTIAQAE
jgi:glycosyltransferase involved in cell wall biosynthesis